MMKKLIVMGIVAAMVMGLAVVACAAPDADWVVMVRASSDATGKLGSLGTFIAGTKATSTDAYNTADGDGTFAGTLNPVAAVYEQGDAGQIAKDYRAPFADGQKKTWNLTVGALNGFSGTVYLTMWNQVGTTTDIDPIGFAWVKLYAADATFAKGAEVASLDLNANGTYSQTGAGIGGAFNQIATQAGTNYILEVQANPVPEPGSMLAMLSGLVGLVGYGIRRRK